MSHLLNKPIVKVALGATALAAGAAFLLQFAPLPSFCANNIRTHNIQVLPVLILTDLLRKVKLTFVKRLHLSSPSYYFVIFSLSRIQQLFSLFLSRIHIYNFSLCNLFS